VSNRFQFINYLNAHDKFRDNENKEDLDSFDVTRILNHYDKTLTEFVKRDTEQQNKIADLEAKLAEKEEEIKQLNNRILFSQSQAPKEQILNILGSQCIQYNPDKAKIDYAVEQLEQLRHDIWTNQQDDGYIDMSVDLYDLNDTIDVRTIQIKEVK
jgi:hypothetical protein